MEEKDNHNNLGLLGGDYSAAAISICSPPRCCRVPGHPVVPATADSALSPPASAALLSPPLPPSAGPATASLLPYSDFNPISEIPPPQRHPTQ